MMYVESTAITSWGMWAVLLLKVRGWWVPLYRFWGKLNKIKNYTGILVPTFKIISVQAKDLNKNWYSTVFQQFCWVWPRLLSWSDILKAFCDVICWKSSQLKSLPRKLPGGSRGTRTVVKHTELLLTFVTQAEAFGVSIFCQHWSHRDCHQKNAVENWDWLSGSTSSTLNHILHWVFVSLFH